MGLLTLALVKGVCLAILGNSLVGTGLFLQKLAIVDSAKREYLPVTSNSQLGDAKVGSWSRGGPLRHSRRNYTGDELQASFVKPERQTAASSSHSSRRHTCFDRITNGSWILGITCSYVGEGFNFISLGLTSPSVVAALGIVAVIVNTFWGFVVLKEHVSARKLNGLFLIIAGVLAVISASLLSAAASQPDAAPIETFKRNMSSPSAYVCLATLALTILALFYRVSFARGRKSLMGHVVLAALLGGVTVNLGKIFTLLIANLLPQVDPPAESLSLFLSLALLLLLIVAALGQEFVKQLALSHFPVTAFQPLFFVVFNVVVIFSAVFLFNELKTGKQWAQFMPLFSVGMLLIFFGSTIISNLNDATTGITPPAKRKRSKAGYSLGSPPETVG